ncbi:MAG TPA: hypothetical protein VFP72_09335 [Kineosporiaceae bacterium]|nr:hypothetical protein [Kineosporiaceae bacterium]
MNDSIALGDEGPAILRGPRPATASGGRCVDTPALQDGAPDLTVGGLTVGDISPHELTSEDVVSVDTLTVVGADVPPAPDAGQVRVTAMLRGGPAAGRQVQVPRIADSFPMFIGVAGANYVRDKGAGETAVYNWWPAGASSPAGDPSARTDQR